MSNEAEKQLKIAQMNTKAVTQKLQEYETRLSTQDQKIGELTGKLVLMEEKLNQFASTQLLAQQFGNGPTTGR